MAAPSSRVGWVMGLIGAAALFVGALWLLWSHPFVDTMIRLFQDQVLLRDSVERWGMLAPVGFVTVQALQVVLAPIPGEVTGFLGGFLFGQRLGFFYSTVGLTAGSLLAFLVGHSLGAPIVRRLVPESVWDRMGFLVKAEGAIVCFLVFLIPGFPKDTACYLFGLSPMPLGIFLATSILGRMPGTWALSAQGAKTASGQYLHLVIITAVVIALALPLYYSRDRIAAWLRSRRATGRDAGV